MAGEGTDIFDEAAKPKGDIFDQAATPSVPVTSDQSNVGNILGEQWLSPEAQSEADTKLAPASAALTSALMTGPFAGEAIEAGGLLPGALKVGRGLIGGTVGAGIGRRTGGEVGGIFGDTGRKVGETAGAIGGGLLGGGLATGLERNPASIKQALAGEPGNIKSLPFGMQRGIPEWMVPGPSEEGLAAAKALEEQKQIGAFMSKGYKPPAEVASPFGQGATFSNSPNLPPAGGLQGTPTPFAQPKVKFVSSFEKPEVPSVGGPLDEAGGSQDLISRMKTVVRPGEEPTAADLKRAGDMTQAPIELLKTLAKFGDKLAQNEINRRLVNP